MNPLGTSLITLAIILGGALGGVTLRQVLPARHLTDDTKDMIKLGNGLIGTIAALVLGLLIATAKGSYDTKSGHVQHLAADLILLDQLLGQYGPEARPAREQLRQTISPIVERIWQENQSDAANHSSFIGSRSGLEAFARIEQLTPQNEAQRTIKDRIMQTSADLAQTRLLLFEQRGSSLPLPFLVVLVFWLAIIFASFGMFSRLNPVQAAALIVFALSASGALYLVLELSEPFSGLMQISSVSLRNALPPL